MKKVIIILLLSFSSLLHAQELGDTLKLQLGGYLLSKNSTTISAENRYFATDINLEDDLGMETKTNTFRASGYYRFNDRHKVEFSYYALDTSSTNTIVRDLYWDGKLYKAGATLDSQLDIDIYKLSYAYSFYHSESLELAGSIGLHVMDIETGLKGSAFILGQIGTYGDGTVNFLAPLPVVGFRIDYAITPRLHINGLVDYFGITIDQFSGDFTDVVLSVEYRVLDNVGIGAGFNYTNLNITVDDDTKYKLKQEIAGALVYLTFNY
jgi:hypothetical protein